MKSIVIEPAATGKESFAGRTVRIAAILLLFGLLAPPGVSPGSAAAPGNASSYGATGDNSAVLPGKNRIFEHFVRLPGLPGIGRVAPGIFRGAQPEPEGYATLKEIGIRTVINLRQCHGEREAVEAAGMRYVEIPMSFFTKADPTTVRKALSVMTDPANQPVFLHCSRGVDRAGVVVAVYRMEVDGWSEEEAEAELDALGFHKIWFELKKTVKEWRSGPHK